jgi:amidase
MVPAALAADGAGSIRIPAACCGLFGLKPHRGRVPRAPHGDGAGDWVVAGALTRSVLDSALVLDAIRGPVPGEADPLPEPPCSFVEAARSPPERLRIAVSRDFPGGTIGRLAPEVGRALDDTAQLLARLGHEVVDRELDLGGRDAGVILALMFRGIRDLVQDVERPHRLERRTRALARPGALVSDRALTRLRDLERGLAARLGRLFADHDVLLTPVLSRPAVRAGIMEGRGAAVTYLWASGWVPFNVLWNSTGQPAASVPAGFTDAGLPLAVQLVGRPQHETTLLSLAAQLEAERPWTHRRPASEDLAGGPAR